MRLLDAALNAVWAMESGALESMLEMLSREHEVTPEALEAYRAAALKDARQASVRNGVAILPVIGPLVKRANIFTEVCGGASHEVVRQDLQTALDDPKVRAIVLNIDSPGGEASGTAEVAQAIRDARGTKPIVAYVSGYAASGGYWIASAADRIVVDPLAILGSVGVQVGFKVREPKAGEKSYRFVSSNAPNKNPEPGTEQAAEQIQGTINAMESVFIADVARNRGVAIETVLSDFGKGGTFVGQLAVDAGLADAVGNFEGVVAELSKTRKQTPAKGAKMSDETTFTAAQRDAAAAEARAAEKSRVANIRAVAAGFAASDADITAAIDNDLTVEAFSLAQSAKAAAKREAEAAAADAASAAEAEAKVKALAALKGDEEAAGKVAGTPAAEAEAEVAVDAIVAGIVSYLPADRRAAPAK